MKTLKEAIQELIDLENRIVELESKLANVKIRDRGPSSTRQMTRDDAHKILLGELSDKSHKEAANILGLSYGQVYSARNGFTFKDTYKQAQQKRK